MTQTGKCDTCRQRKVKCDEDRPKCSACRKKQRPCIYSYGKASAFVLQDPKQMTKHGVSKVASIKWTLDAPGQETDLTNTLLSDLRTMTERPAEDGQGVFQTLAPVCKSQTRPSKRRETWRKQALQAYLQKLQQESSPITSRPSSPETTLIAAYIDMLGYETPEKQPLSILGTWVQSVPSRIGSNRMVDLAVEFLISSYSKFWDDSHSKRKIARASKVKALRELQLAVSNTQTAATYEVLLATKLHYAAEALMGIDTMYHAIHAFGLAELLKSGHVSGVDDEHFWNLIDNTYIDDVNEGMLAGRSSVYDNDFYLSATYPPPLGSDQISLSAFQKASMSIMHIFIQCPRLTGLVRNAILHPKDINALASAMSLMESLVQLDLARYVAELLQSAVTVIHTPTSPEVADILPDSLSFDSVQSMVLCTRYWMLQNILCGLAEALYRHFPDESGISLLPPPERIRAIDIDAAMNLAKSLPWAESTSQKLPLVPLRLHTPLQISIGPWHRIIRYVSVMRSAGQTLEPGVDVQLGLELTRAERMKDWLIERCNRIHKQWDVAVADEKPLLEALDSMAGEPIPDWLPVRVRFEAEDGEMVIKLDYENRTGTYSEQYDIGKPPPKRSPHPLTPNQKWQRENFGVQELPLRPNTDNDTGFSMRVSPDSAFEGTSTPPRTSSTSPVDFIHSTGRNLCTTSGWWPETSGTSTLLLDSTHKASAFAKLRPSHHRNSPTLLTEYPNGHPCLASSWWPQTPNSLSTTNSTSASNMTPSNVRLSPAWNNTNTITFDNQKKNGCYSPAWSSNP
ncbi:hypothetical protein T440DRAFT_491129 [Plenodomus tracheiphilus IPT5]|uniref:Zn(2)-C6 fungal-type domain-containing protein n=1 Tax=Plenodomus tracheiphilus IPT5 TaxID=1408161 RepID=A0A6A7AZI6_9PLEO|nr:hypothetical protein T440DRAFT_491129 [Plenodomus tracheiphilus IPT5]